GCGRLSGANGCAPGALGEGAGRRGRALPAVSTASSRLVTALFDGDRLRQARLFKGWRKVDVAAKLGLTPAATSQYEQGRTRPSTAALAALSLHLGFPPEFFQRGRPAVHIDQGQAQFRRLRSSSKLDRDRLLVRLEFL